MASIQQRMPEEKPLLTPESRLPGNMPHPPSLEPENLEARETRASESGTPDRLTSEEPRRARPPQCIAHRGYAAKYPENTIAAFQGAADAGADALETDLHLSRDGVVVLSHVCLPSPSPASPRSHFSRVPRLLGVSHLPESKLQAFRGARPDATVYQDASLKRCFGVDKLVSECDWSYLQTLRTVGGLGAEPMPSLADLLEFLAGDDRKDVGGILDVKVSLP